MVQSIQNSGSPNINTNTNNPNNNNNNNNSSLIFTDSSNLTKYSQTQQAKIQNIIHKINNYRAQINQIENAIVQTVQNVKTIVDPIENYSGKNLMISKPALLANNENKLTWVNIDNIKGFINKNSNNNLFEKNYTLINSPSTSSETSNIDYFNRKVYNLAQDETNLQVPNSIPLLVTYDQKYSEAASTISEIYYNDTNNTNNTNNTINYKIPNYFLNTVPPSLSSGDPYCNMIGLGYNGMIYLGYNIPSSSTSSTSCGNLLECVENYKTNTPSSSIGSNSEFNNPLQSKSNKPSWELYKEDYLLYSKIYIEDDSPIPPTTDLFYNGLIDADTAWGCFEDVKLTGLSSTSANTSNKYKDNKGNLWQQYTTVTNFNDCKSQVLNNYPILGLTRQPQNWWEKILDIPSPFLSCWGADIQLPIPYTAYKSCESEESAVASAEQKDETALTNLDELYNSYKKPFTKAHQKKINKDWDTFNKDIKKFISADEKLIACKEGCSKISSDSNKQVGGFVNKSNKKTYSLYSITSSSNYSFKIILIGYDHSYNDITGNPIEHGSLILKVTNSSENNTKPRFIPILRNTNFGLKKTDLKSFSSFSSLSSKTSLNPNEITNELYSSDGYFKFILNGTQKQGIQININGNLTASTYLNTTTQIGAKFERLNKFFKNHDTPINSTIYTTYKVPFIDNRKLGDIGFIELAEMDPVSLDHKCLLSDSTSQIKATSSNSAPNYGITASNPFLFKKYPSPNNTPNSSSKFITLKGDLSSISKSHSTNPHLSSKTTGNESTCKLHCYKSPDCQAWQYSDDTCYSYKSLSPNAYRDVLKETAASTAMGSTKPFELKVPNVGNNDNGCPNSINNELILTQLNPVTPNQNLYKAPFTVRNKNSESAFYYKYDKDSSMGTDTHCNIAKMIKPYETKLKACQGKLNYELQTLETTISNLTSVEQNIYKKLIADQKKFNNQVSKYSWIKKKIDTQNNINNISGTIDGSLEDTTFNMINNNYEYIIWTILAILIIIIALNISKK